jgi:hypothetical protein
MINFKLFKWLIIVLLFSAASVSFCEEELSDGPCDDIKIIHISSGFTIAEKNIIHSDK